jgi:hypothetical protein
MRTFLAGMTAAAMVAALATPAFAKTETVTGKVVDEGCSPKAMEMEKHGDHAGAQAMEECVLRCAKEGEPLALLTADGKVYRIVGGLAANKNAKLIAHVNHTVQITGEVGQQEGKATIAADALKMVAK